jgi:alpha-amylase/alpha-mannosidase (GH57 family)
MYWANFLHIYQPPTQTEAIVRKVTEECYRTLVRVLNEAPRARFTLNISGILTEQLDRYGFGDVIAGLRQAAERGQIEFTGSAMYHPILPLIPKEEVVRQIRLNTEVNRHYFGEIYQPQGFFPPEMCYSFDVAKTVAELGFHWLIVDEIAFGGKIGQVSSDTIYRIKGLPELLVFFKERPFSAGITYGKYPNAAPFLKALASKLDAKSYLLTGTDGEVYGHHRPGQERLLQEVFRIGSPGTCTVSELVGLFEKRKEVSPLPSSWSTWEDEMAQGIPYPQWDFPGHGLHQLQWQLTRRVMELIHQVPENAPGYPKARRLLDEGLHSCQYWWASCRPWWDTGMIEWGAMKLRDAVYAARDSLAPRSVSEVSELFNLLVNTTRAWQETGKAKELKEQYLRQHREVATELTFGESKGGE